MIDTLVRIIEFARGTTAIVRAALEAVADGEVDRADELLPQDLATSIALRAAEAEARGKLGPRGD